MRKILLTSAAISALALSGPAIAASSDTAGTIPVDPISADLEESTFETDGGVRLVDMEDPLEEGEDDDETDAPEDESDMLAETDEEGDEDDDVEDDEYDLLAQDDDEDDDEEDEEDDDVPDAG